MQLLDHRQVLVTLLVEIAARFPASSKERLNRESDWKSCLGQQVPVTGPLR
jgi:hypothetical protein